MLFTCESEVGNGEVEVALEENVGYETIVATLPF